MMFSFLRRTTANRSRRSALRVSALAAGLVTLAAPEARAQWVTTYEQFYLQAPHNWEFRNRYQAADRLFNAFDFGHAILYETLWTKPNANPSELEVKWYRRLTEEILVKPPRVPLEEAAIEIAYARLAPEAKMMFDWAHLLHRQIYDVWADESIPIAAKDSEIARLIAYYKTRPDVAFSSKPKSMELMQEQPYSLAFRQQYPKFNGLIWAYHWLQVGLYEPLVVSRSVAERQAGIRATVGRFWQMLERPTGSMPYQMPMTAAVAPEFTKRYPEAAIIFDNLHSMHDVVSDILTNDGVPRNRKRAEIMRAARLYRDDTSYVMPVNAWLTMSAEMGVENMGGPAVGFTPALPEKTVTYGAVMDHDQQTGRMTGMKSGEMTGAHAGMRHGADSARATQTDHSRMAMPKRDSSVSRPDSAAAGHEGHAIQDSTRNTALTVTNPRLEQLTELHMRMMANPEIRAEVMADTAMRRMVRDVMEDMPAEHRRHTDEMIRESAPPKARPPRKPAPRRPTPTSRPANPHGRHQPKAPAGAKGTPNRPAAPEDTVRDHGHHEAPAAREP